MGSGKTRKRILPQKSRATLVLVLNGFLKKVIHDDYLAASCSFV
jgi:hypothetical protein